ncbi:MAG: hypothetical protein JNM93_01000 [Bacteriovoracaceae bacterium]|nr:hypothetical protein [Bacteriovoracaceae bacterium]
MTKLIFLALVLNSCAVYDLLFGPYSPDEYCSGNAVKQYDEGMKNYEGVNKSNNEILVQFFIDNEANFNQCFKEATVDRIKSRYYCTTVRFMNFKGTNKIVYMSVDNLKDGITHNLRNCIEEQLFKIEDLKFLPYIHATYRYPLKLSR